jgi:hypothetical protein
MCERRERSHPAVMLAIEAITALRRRRRTLGASRLPTRPSRASTRFAARGLAVCPQVSDLVGNAAAQHLKAGETFSTIERTAYHWVE